MSLTLHHLPARSLHLAHWWVNMMLSVLLSWAALDHLMRPDDVLENAGRLGFATLDFMKSVTGKIKTAMPQFAFRFLSQRSVFLAHCSR